MLMYINSAFNSLLYIVYMVLSKLTLLIICPLITTSQGRQCSYYSKMLLQCSQYVGWLESAEHVIKI